MYVCTPYVCSASSGQKSASSSLDVELQMVVKHLVGAGS